MLYKERPGVLSTTLRKAVPGLPDRRELLPVRRRDLEGSLAFSTRYLVTLAHR